MLSVVMPYLFDVIGGVSEEFLFGLGVIAAVGLYRHLVVGGNRVVTGRLGRYRLTRYRYNTTIDIDIGGISTHRIYISKQNSYIWINPSCAMVHFYIYLK